MKAYALIKELDSYYYEKETLGIYQEFDDAQKEWLRLEAIRAPRAAEIEANDYQGIDDDEEAHNTTYTIQPIDIITVRKAFQMRRDQ